MRPTALLNALLGAHADLTAAEQVLVWRMETLRRRHEEFWEMKVSRADVCALEDAYVRVLGKRHAEALGAGEKIDAFMRGLLKGIEKTLQRMPVRRGAPVRLVRAALGDRGDLPDDLLPCSCGLPPGTCDSAAVHRARFNRSTSGSQARPGHGKSRAQEEGTADPPDAMQKALQKAMQDALQMKGE
jgi:hypothetical protein